MSKPIQQHTVPHFYLSRYAAGERLRAVDIRTGRRFGISAKDATTSRYFYDLPEQPGVDGGAERVFGYVENAVERLLTRVSDGHWPLTADERDLLATFATLQFMRGPDHRRQVRQQVSSSWEASHPATWRGFDSYLAHPAISTRATLCRSPR